MDLAPYLFIGKGVGKLTCVGRIILICIVEFIPVAAHIVTFRCLNLFYCIMEINGNVCGKHGVAISIGFHALNQCTRFYQHGTVGSGNVFCRIQSKHSAL